MNRIETTEDASNLSTPSAINDQDYAAVESPPPIEEVIWEKSPAIDDQDYEAIESPAIQEDIWEKFEKQLKQTQQFLPKTKLSVSNIFHNIKSRLASRKMKVAMEKLEDEYRSLKQQLEKRHADLLNPSDQENLIADLKSKVVKITVNINCKEVTEIIKWKPFTDGKIGPNAVGGGDEPRTASSGSPLLLTLVGRAWVGGQLVPGKIVLDRKKTSIRSLCCLVIIQNKQLKCTEFEYLVKPSFGTLVWKPASRGRVPTGAVVGGRTDDGETLFVGRTEFEENHFEKHLIIGMVQPSRLALKFLWDGQVKKCRKYEVLCHIYD